ncbi:GIY-YIG nuclease family protein [Bdellovibrio sp. HCB2-146]|uniref:GIY-YIG nuclease family protein n=1 Tax=Bdellovibrio sp. HCB2-146 TaxID=3394362 RepID=UPI0039BCA5E2
MTLRDLPVFFLDLQTTGAKPETANILEIAWGLSEQNQIRSSLVKQPEDQAVPRRILSLTGIREEELTDSKPISDLFQSLTEEVANRPAVIHFAQFEKPFLTATFEALQITAFPIICTHEIAKRLFPNLPTRGIKGLAGYFGHFSGELKRAASQVEATQVIWKHLIEALEKENILTLAELQDWLQKEVPKKRTKYEYPMPKDKRLSLPDEPGVYRMISQWGEVLYVGKATSLHDRVNSYFRGQKNRDPRKLEMLTQAYDLRVTTTRSPLESALLETDEIKKHNPRYNIVLKTGTRSLTFFSRDFLSMNEIQDELHPIGPFSSTLIFDSILKLNFFLREGVPFDSEMFYDTYESSLLEEGFDIFCARHGLPRTQFHSMRSILALGMIFVKNSHDEEEDDLLQEAEAEESAEDISEEEVIVTADDIADKFERHFKRGAHAYLRARKLTKFLNSNIEYSVAEEGPRYLLSFRNGSLASPEAPSTASILPWEGLGVDTYDRMSVLLSELTKIQNRDGSYELNSL